MFFFWLNNVELAKERVKTRVAEGGHHIEPEVIERRYAKGIYNLFDLYIPVVDQVLIFDNSTGTADLIAEKLFDKILKVIDVAKFDQLKHYYDDRRRD